MAEQNAISTSHRFKDITGQVFGHLKVLGFADREMSGGVRFIRWRCQCECGNIVVVRGNNLSSGNSARCVDCSRRSIGDRTRTHGRSKTPEYRVWSSMIQRCHNDNDSSYADYGARGIKVCVQWHDFQTFFADMGPRPSAKHSIERLNSAGNYEPSNCVWATPFVQARNTRKNRLLTFNGETMCLSAWDEKLGFTYGTIRNRLMRGWTVAEALRTPLVPQATGKRTKGSRFRVSESQTS